PRTNDYPNTRPQQPLPNGPTVSINAAMRAIWTGSIAFGLVNVPVKVYSATESHDLRMHQVHNKDGGRIRYERHCEICGELVDYTNIDRAYDDGDNRVIITKDDFQALPADHSDDIDV